MATGLHRFPIDRLSLWLRLAGAGALLVLLRTPLPAQMTGPSDSLLRQVALRVADLDARRQLPTATAATIDSLLAYYSDSVVYEHPGVGAVVRGKAALRAGMLQYIGSRPTVATEVPRVTVGPLVAVLETPAGPDPRTPTRTIPATRRAVRILEFDTRGMVRRILDFPW